MLDVRSSFTLQMDHLDRGNDIMHTYVVVIASARIVHFPCPLPPTDIITPSPHCADNVHSVHALDEKSRRVRACGRACGNRRSVSRA